MRSSLPTVRLTRGQRQWAAQAIVALAVALAVAVVTRVDIVRRGMLDRLEFATIDYRFQLRGTRAVAAEPSHVVVVEIGEDSFRSLPGTFPWPRSYYARLLHNLQRAGARAVGVDLILSDSDRLSPRNDSLFRTALAATRIGVLAGKREVDREGFISTSAAENFSNIFYPVDSALGLVNIRPDADGVYRLYNPYFVVDAAGGERPLPTFAFAVLNRYLGLPPGTVPRQEEGSFAYAGRHIPQYDRGSMLVNFCGPSRTFPHVGIQDVLDDESFQTADEIRTGEQINTFSDPDYGYLHDGTFRDRIVLVGVTVPEYKDLFPVAIARGERKGDNLMYGVELHANVIENVLRGDFLAVQPTSVEVSTTIGCVLLAFLITSVLKELKTRRYVLTETIAFVLNALLIIGVGWLAIRLFIDAGTVLRVTSMSLALFAGYVGSTAYHYVVERKQRQLIKTMFSTYVSPTLVDELISNPEKLVLGGRRDELTVMFSDIEGFTTISQGMDPETLVALLNEYLSVMSDIIFQNLGTLDKYEGDAIMAFWGAPLPQPDHAYRCCLSALQMQGAVRAMNDRWLAEGKPALRTRIGINTGEMIVGNMGSLGKFAYTVIGDSVNLASRLEGANKEYRTSVMASLRTYELVRDRILGRELDRIAVVGRSAPVTVFELLDTRDAVPEQALGEFLERYHAGLDAYYRMRWREARQAFRAALALRPDDRPTRVHLERITNYETSPPPPDWGGVHVLKEK